MSKSGRLFLRKRSIVFLFTLLIFLQAEEWLDLKGTHFIVFFKENREFAKEVLRKAEYYYRRIALDLGYERYSNFWLWDKRVKIFIYPNYSLFVNSTHQPAWSKGMADYQNKMIVSFYGSERFLTTILPHEITHLIFRDYVGFKSNIPLWIDEGIAQWEEEGKREFVRKIMKILLHKGKLIPLKELTETDIRSINDEEKVHLYYVEAVSLIDFIMKRFGATKFIDFCRELRDGTPFLDALKVFYPQIDNPLGELQDEWIKYINESREGERWNSE